MNKRVWFNRGRQLSRRTLLRGAGVAMGMPWLSAMCKARADGDESSAPRRFVSITLGLGLTGDNLNPMNAGRGYQPSRYLEQVQDLREQFTVVSGASHPQVSGGHRAEASLLTAAPMSSEAVSRNTVSLDQLLAKHLGNQTRFPSLVLASSGSSSPSYTENGSMIPAEDSPAQLFARLFIDDSQAERERHAQRARQGRSIMDLVADDSRALQKKVGRGDRDRLDAYFTSVRDLEQRLVESEAWALRPKPKVSVPKPIDIGNPSDFIGRQRLMCDMIRLALATDSSRFITLHLGGGGGVVPLEGVEEGYHTLSHHGLDEEKLQQLAIVETAIVGAWGDFLRDLARSDDHGSNLLDHTSVLLTSNLGNSSSHDNRNMPVLFAGGGFRHGSHLAFDRKNNYPLPNLFVSILQQTGLEHSSFATSTGTMSGLEPV